MNIYFMWRVYEKWTGLGWKKFKSNTCTKRPIFKFIITILRVYYSYYSTINRKIIILHDGVFRLESATCASVSCKSGQKCLVEKKTGRPRCVTCNLPCPEPEMLPGKRRSSVEPVCGSNDKTYRSWCHMFMDACATGLVIETKAPGPCPPRHGVDVQDGDIGKR